MICRVIKTSYSYGMSADHLHKSVSMSEITRMAIALFVSGLGTLGYDIRSIYHTFFGMFFVRL